MSQFGPSVDCRLCGQPKSMTQMSEEDGVCQQCCDTVMAALCFGCEIRFHKTAMEVCRGCGEEYCEDCMGNGFCFSCLDDIDEEEAMKYD